MNRPLLAAALILALALPAFGARSGGSHHTHGTHSSGTHSSTSSRQKVHVKGYVRKDGTYVPPHDRAAPAGGHATSPKSPAAASGTASIAPHSRGCKTCPRDEHGRIRRDPRARAAFLRRSGYPHGRPGYVVDHIVPLECGGADSPSNMQWQTIAEAKAKDKTEHNCRR